MFKDENVKKGIYSGIIASMIMTIFIQPILKIIGGFGVKLITLFYTNFSNHIYITAAKGDINHFQYRLYTFFFGIVGGLFTGLITYYLDKNVKRKRKRERSLTKVKIFTYLLMFILTYSYLLTILYIDNTSFEMNIVFKQRLNAVAPYIDEQSRELILSKWALMESKMDYTYIVNNLRKVAGDNNIKLP